MIQKKRANGLSKKTLTVILLAMNLFLILELFAEEKAREMGILIVPVGKVDRRVIEWLKTDLTKVFDKEVTIGKELPEPDYAYNRKRNQYLSTAILKTLIEPREFNSFEKILGIVDHDLYVPELNFVFGEATHKAAVISITRLRQEFYHLPEDQALFHKRVLTEAVHELGHTYGLGHCRNPQCVMFFSNSLVDTDRKGAEFCPNCKKRIKK
ncbi:MAG: archaemetzincin family Zn-dependent metalloprotease [Thermodesulfobacteriota bacterium]